MHLVDDSIYIYIYREIYSKQLGLKFIRLSHSSVQLDIAKLAPRQVSEG